MPTEDGLAKVHDIAALLREQAYKGPITLAPHPACFTGMKNEEILKQCSAALDALLKAPEAGKNLVSAGAHN
jgi:hypothetical protein